MNSLCVITPTIGRPTLRRAIESADLGPGDMWLVVGDGPQPEAKRVVGVLRTGRPWLRYIEGPRSRNRGNEQRDIAMRMATVSHFLFLDDDDIFTPGAIDKIKDRLKPAPIIFRMRHNGEVIWKTQNIGPGNVGGSMLCVPNLPDLPRWANGRGYASDQTFIHGVVDRWGSAGITWAGEIIVECNPK